MERGAINGVPVWIRLLELTGNERTVIKEAPGVDGAVVETQGQIPQRYRVDFTLIQDGEVITEDVETASFELRAMLLSGGPFTLEAPSFNEITGLWLDSGGYTIKFFDEAKLQISEGSITFVEAEPFIILSGDAAADVAGAISGLSEAAASDFGGRMPDGGAVPDQNALDVLDEINDWLDAVQASINTAFQPVNDVAAQIEILRGQQEQLLAAPKNFASSLIETAARLMNLVPSLASQGDPRLGSAAVQDPSTDKAAVVYIEALDAGATFDAGVPPPQGEIIDPPSTEDLVEIDEGNAARSIAFSSITVSVSMAITSTKFVTANSVLDVAEALDPVFERIFALPNLDYRVYGQAQALRVSTLKFLSDTAAALPRIRTYTTPRTTDPFAVLPWLYDTIDGEDQVQAAVESIIALNSLGGDYEIPAETVLTYLDPLVA